MINFKQLIEQATTAKSNEYDDNFEYTGKYTSMDMDDSFKTGASLPNELLLMALEALEFYSTKRHPVYQSTASETLHAIRAKLESEIK